MRRIILLALAALPAACASPDPTYYTLAAQPGQPLGGAPHTIELRRTGLAGYLDRSDIVDSNSGYRLRISNVARWGEPLGDMIGRVLAEDLNQRLPGSTVFNDTGAIAAEADATVETDIQRFDAAPDGTVTLSGQIAVSRGRSSGNRPPALSRSIRLSVHANGGGVAATVAAMSNALSQMADTIAAMLQATGGRLPPGDLSAHSPGG